MNIAFNGFNENTVTFEADSTVVAGCLVKMVDDNKVAAAENGDKFCGVCVNVREGYAAVQLSGYTEVAFSGELSVGYQTLVASDNTGVKSGDGREYLVLSATGTYAGIIL